MALNRVQPRKMPVWIKLWGVPMEFLHNEGVSYAVSAVGKPLQVDIVTATNSRVHFVRASVEMEADGEFINDFDMECADGSVYRVDVEYHILPPRCSLCRVFGHSGDKCSNQLLTKDIRATKIDLDSGDQPVVESSPSPDCQPVEANKSVVPSSNKGVAFKEVAVQMDVAQDQVTQGKGKSILVNDSTESSSFSGSCPVTIVAGPSICNVVTQTPSCSPVETGTMGGDLGYREEVPASSSMMPLRVSEIPTPSTKPEHDQNLEPGLFDPRESKKRKSRKKRAKEKKCRDMEAEGASSPSSAI